ncbi:MAG: C40 family peptidase [Dinghuibacter sp.]|nr:C40 family peptidase [Dinghuibacter sp.]
MQKLSKYYSKTVFFLIIFLGSCLPATVLAHPHNDPGANNSSVQSIITRFSRLVRTDEAEIQRYIKLYRFIDEWFGTPYLWAGCSKRGIDCSCFVQKLYNQVYNIRINRTSLMQFCKDVVLFTNRSQFQMGDLVFFKTPIRRETRYNRVTHVGFYLTNGYFVQSSSSGVNIASLNSGYWKNYFVAAGRLKEVYYKQARVEMPAGEVDNNRVIEVEEDSDFDPLLYPEDVDAINNEYARLLHVDKELMIIPEVFQFVEKNRYAPYNISSKCVKSATDNSCFISTFFKEVFQVGLDNTNNHAFLAKYTGRLGAKARDTLLDIVRLKQEKNGRTDVKTGIYLHNGFFLHLDNRDVSISSIDDPAFAGYTREFFRVNEELSRKMIGNLRELRKNGGILPPETDKPQQQGPVNILKRDSLPPAQAPPPEMGPQPPPDAPQPQTEAGNTETTVPKKKKKKARQ